MKYSFLLFAVVLAALPAAVIFAQGKDLPYKDGDSSLTGYFAAPKAKAGKVPGVLVLHAWFGLTDHEKTTVNRLSGLGYYALAADVYGPGNRPTTVPEAAKQAGYYKAHYEAYHSRIKAGIAALVKQGADPDNIIVIGYCFGGTGAIEAARAGMPVKGIVSFHGGLARDSARTIAPIGAKVLVQHGADDPYESPQEIKLFQQEMRTAKADWQMVYFSNAVHSFTDPSAGTDNSKGAAYNELADKRSWEYMQQFIKEVTGK